mmetsp:Transcript_29768/g.102516  ORF Transcript_29768/g.102516 Transcript_29768/m.102516 type:complete len:474 (+) Transcript_29768:570-1991(+)
MAPSLHPGRARNGSPCGMEFWILRPWRRPCGDAAKRPCLPRNPWRPRLRKVRRNGESSVDWRRCRCRGPVVASGKVPLVTTSLHDGVRRTEGRRVGMSSVGVPEAVSMGVQELLGPSVGALLGSAASTPFGRRVGRAGYKVFRALDAGFQSALDVAVVVDVEVEEELWLSAEFEERFDGELLVLAAVCLFEDAQVHRDEEDLQLDLEVIFDRVEHVEDDAQCEREDQKVARLRHFQQVPAEVARHALHELVLHAQVRPARLERDVDQRQREHVRLLRVRPRVGEAGEEAHDVHQHVVLANRNGAARRRKLVLRRAVDSVDVSEEHEHDVGQRVVGRAPEERRRARLAADAMADVEHFRDVLVAEQHAGVAPQRQRGQLEQFQQHNFVDADIRFFKSAVRDRLRNQIHRLGRAGAVARDDVIYEEFMQAAQRGAGDVTVRRFGQHHGTKWRQQVVRRQRRRLGDALRQAQQAPD